eukprot:2435986-Prymnesium_polylepis.1
MPPPLDQAPKSQRTPVSWCGCSRRIAAGSSKAHCPSRDAGRSSRLRVSIPRTHGWSRSAADTSRGLSVAITSLATGELRPMIPSPASRPGVKRPALHLLLARLGVSICTSMVSAVTLAGFFRTCGHAAGGHSTGAQRSRSAS